MAQSDLNPFITGDVIYKLQSKLKASEKRNLYLLGIIGKLKREIKEYKHIVNGGLL